MDGKSSNVSVSLTRCDDIKFNKKIVSINSNDTVKNYKTTKLKRSLRLSKKRTFQDESVSEINYQSADITKKNKITKKPKCIKSNPEEPISNDSVTKKFNNRLSFLKCSTNKNLYDMPYVQHALSAVEENGLTLPIKTLKNKTISKRNTFMNNKSIARDANKNYVSDGSEESVEFVEYNRKRCRSLLQTNYDVNICNNFKVNKQKTKNLAMIIEKLRSVNESDSSKMLDDTMTLVSESNNKSPEVITKQVRDKLLSVNVKHNESCSAEGTDKSETILTATESEEMIVSEFTIEEEDTSQHSHFRTFEREIHLLSTRFKVPNKMLKKIIVNESLSVFHEKYSKSVTPSMVTVSPIVGDGNESKWMGNREKGDLNIKYKLEPIRESEAYEKINLKDCMKELSNTMPSWSLSIVTNPPRYVISQMSIKTYGTPVVIKSIVLDRYFRASVYVNQCLQYKYCKRYNTATEVVNLIKDLNAIL